MSKLVSGTVFDIRRFSIHDGPGIRTTVFFKGCPLSCWWCHNPESQSLQPELMLRESRCMGCGACQEACLQEAIRLVDGAAFTDSAACSHCGSCVTACAAEAREMAGQKRSVDEVLAQLQRDIPFYDESGGGVTFSGGEPLLQPAFLLALLQACKALEIHTAVDTSGYTSWKTLSSLLPYADLFLYDLKLMDDARHRRYTGVSNERILRNLEMLCREAQNGGPQVVVRVPVIPGITGSSENLRQIGEFVAGLGSLQRVDILPYHHAAAPKYERLGRAYLLPSALPPSEESMAEAAGILQGFGLQVKIGG